MYGALFDTHNAQWSYWFLLRREAYYMQVCEKQTCAFFFSSDFLPPKRILKHWLHFGTLLFTSNTFELFTHLLLVYINMLLHVLYFIIKCRRVEVGYLSNDRGFGEIQVIANWTTALILVFGFITRIDLQSTSKLAPA